MGGVQLRGPSSVDPEKDCDNNHATRTREPPYINTWVDRDNILMTPDGLNGEDGETAPADTQVWIMTQQLHQITYNMSQPSNWAHYKHPAFGTNLHSIGYIFS